MRSRKAERERREQAKPFRRRANGVVASSLERRPRAFRPLAREHGASFHSLSARRAVERPQQACAAERGRGAKARARCVPFFFLLREVDAKKKREKKSEKGRERESGCERWQSTEAILFSFSATRCLCVVGVRSCCSSYSSSSSPQQRPLLLHRSSTSSMLPLQTAAPGGGRSGASACPTTTTMELIAPRF